MNTRNGPTDETDDPLLANLLRMCRTDAERERARAQWRERQAGVQVQHEASRKEKRKRDEAAFERIVHDNYPFSDESFQADWPLLRARLVTNIIKEGVSRDWERFLKEDKL